MSRPLIVHLWLDDAVAIQQGLADLACWCRGFEAGRATADVPGDFGPLGIESLRDMNRRLKAAIEAAEAQTSEGKSP